MEPMPNLLNFSESEQATSSAVSPVRIKIIKGAYLWKIPKFSSIGLLPTESSTFSIGHFKWSLQLIAKKKKMFLVLHTKPNDVNEALMEFRCCLLKDNAEEFELINEQIRWLENSVPIEIGIGHAYIYNRKEEIWILQNNFLCDDVLSIRCEITLATDKYSMNVMDRNIRLCCPLANDWKTILENGDFSDVILEVKKQEIPAHKIVLAAKSAVFAAMFKTNMKEKIENRVIIEDFGYDTVKQMLYFMYTRQISRHNFDEYMELYMIAEKYAIYELKKLCVERLMCTLKIKNAIDILTFSADNGIVELQTFCLDFIRTHLMDIMNTPEWSMYFNELPVPIILLLRNIASNTTSLII